MPSRCVKKRSRPGRPRKGSKPLCKTSQLKAITYKVGNRFVMKRFGKPDKVKRSRKSYRKSNKKRSRKVRRSVKRSKK